MGVNDIRVREKLKNELYSEVLFKLNSRRLCLRDFSKEFNKSRISLRDNILALHKDGYLKREIEGKLKYFSINWEKIIKEFLLFLKERNSVRYKEIDKIILKDIEKNKILQCYFKKYFYVYWKKVVTTLYDEKKPSILSGNRTIHGLFMDTLYINTKDDIDINILDMNNKEVKQFINFVEKWSLFLFSNNEFLWNKANVMSDLHYYFGKYGEGKRIEREKRMKKLELKKDKKEEEIVELKTYEGWNYYEDNEKEYEDYENEVERLKKAGYKVEEGMI